MFQPTGEFRVMLDLERARILAFLARGREQWDSLDIMGHSWETEVAECQVLLKSLDIVEWLLRHRW
jgi:hypothetical protein